MRCRWCCWWRRGNCCSQRSDPQQLASALGNVRIARYVPAPEFLRGVADADARGDDGLVGRRDTIVDDAQAAGAGDEVDAILRSGDVERLAQARGAAAEVAVALGRRARGAH